MIAGRIGLALLAGTLAGAAAPERSWAQAVEVPTHQPMSGVELTLELSERGTDRVVTRATTRSASTDARQLRIGSEVVVCVTASRSGYITLWGVDENDHPTRVYPNRFSHENGEEMTGAPVTEGMRYCLGDDSRFNFTVGGRPGSTYQLSLNWTPVENDALPSDAYVQIGPRTRSASEQQARFAATHLSYSPTD